MCYKQASNKYELQLFEAHRSITNVCISTYISMKHTITISDSSGYHCISNMEYIEQCERIKSMKQKKNGNFLQPWRFEPADAANHWRKIHDFGEEYNTELSVWYMEYCAHIKRHIRLRVFVFV